MPPAVSSSLGAAAYLALFTAVGAVFLLVNLLIGKLLRPADPRPEKLEIYECGEPPAGSSFIQFDLRFYVVALVFVIFDVEVAFFFPWAAAFGKLTHLADPRVAVVEQVGPSAWRYAPPARGLMRELGVVDPRLPDRVPPSLAGAATGGPNEPIESAAAAEAVVRAGAMQLAWLTVADILIFFLVLLAGFAYVWRRGDLNWVRATTAQRLGRSETTRRPEAPAGAPGG